MISFDYDLLGFLNNLEDVRFALVITIGSNTQVNFLLAGIFQVSNNSAVNGIGKGHLNIIEKIGGLWHCLERSFFLLIHHFCK